MTEQTKKNERKKSEGRKKEKNMNEEQEGEKKYTRNLYQVRMPKAWQATRLHSELAGILPQTNKLTNKCKQINKQVTHYMHASNNLN